MSEKALPNDDSDYNLPGRAEESDSTYFGPPIGDKPIQDGEDDAPKSNSRTLIIAVLAFAVISAGFFSYYFVNQNDIDSQILDNAAFETLEEKMVKHYGVGKFGSAHAHAAVSMFIKGDQIDFGMPQFQVQSKYIHFENDNPYQVHKHATNVPLHILFASLGMEIKDDCINLRFIAGMPEEYCVDDDNSMTVLVNGKPHSSIVRYEINHNDRILISIGDPESVPEQMKRLESFEIHDLPKRNQAISDREIFV
ncbi:hypothetical protein K0U27_09400 [archaeon]|nr:hypothetical protein [archaeon]